MRANVGMRKQYGAGATGQRRSSLIRFAGRNGAGAITVTSTPALAVGDIVTGVVRATGATDEESSAFQTKITVAGQIQQTSASNLSANNYFATIDRKK